MNPSRRAPIVNSLFNTRAAKRYKHIQREREREREIDRERETHSV